MCKCCFKRARTRQATVARAHEECEGLAHKMAAVVAHPRGHVLAAAEDDSGRPLVACVRCGCWAERQPKVLVKACKGAAAPRSEGFQALRRMAIRKHPQHARGNLVGPVVALQKEQQEAASKALMRYLHLEGRARGRRVPGPVGDSQGRTTCLDELGAASDAQSGGQGTSSARERLEALRGRVVAKALGR